MKIKLIKKMITADGDVFNPGLYEVKSVWLNETLDCIYIEIQREEDRKNMYM